MAETSLSRPYHHGHLRRALLDTALEILTESGLSGLTLRAVARRAGVSEAAPYHHFAGKAALVEALVVETLEQLKDALQHAFQATPGTPLDRLTATGVAYVNFAEANRSRFSILYRPELRALVPDHLTPERSKQSPINQAGMAAYHVLIDAIADCQRAGMVVSGDPIPLALTAWATVHGLAELLVNGAVTSEILPKGLEPTTTRLAHLVTAILAQGLVTDEIREQENKRS